MKALTYSAPRRPAVAALETIPQSGMDLERAILALPEKHRVILCLLHFEQLSLGQIAEVLGASEQQISAECLQAVQQLNRSCKGGAGLAAA